MRGGELLRGGGLEGGGRGEQWHQTADLSPNLIIYAFLMEYMIKY
jgi:hypothetical protein